MRILGIETATVVCGAAVVEDGLVRSEEQVNAKNAHAENIMRLVDTSLRQSHVSPERLDAIAVSIGPGSFTGLRIGLSVAKGLACALGKPIVAVPTLRALAQRALASGTVSTPFILSALDARRDEVYCQLFRIEGNVIHAEGEERDLSVKELQSALGMRDITITGDALPKLRSSLQSGHIRFTPDDVAVCSAGSIALIGETMAAQGEFAEAATLEPKYIKDFFTKGGSIAKTI